MIRLDGNHLLMIEPTGRPSAEPTIDFLTRRMAGALAAARVPDSCYRGIHGCTGDGCRAHSDNVDHFVAAVHGDALTNSLAVHYLAYHRADVSADEIAKVGALLADEAEPTEAQLTGMHSR